MSYKNRQRETNWKTGYVIQYEMMESRTEC